MYSLLVYRLNSGGLRYNVILGTTEFQKSLKGDFPFSLNQSFLMAAIFQYYGQHFKMSYGKPTFYDYFGFHISFYDFFVVGIFFN